MHELVTIADPAGPLRAASIPWAALPIGRRLAVIARFRRTLARRAEEVAATLSDLRPIADTLAAEILPTLEAARFLEREAAGLLAPKRLGRAGRPLWLAGIDQLVTRAPYGALLILAPSNYPLMLPAIQALQALAAGNAVAWKPGRGGAAAARAIRDLLLESGLPPELIHIADEDDATGKSLAEAGFDRIVLTGSATTGRAVLAAAAATLTPCTVELSGADPVYVLPGARLELVADCLTYGLRLNGGATCIAPRRVFIRRHLAPALEALLQARIANIPSVPIPPRALEALRTMAEAALASGARPLGPIPDQAAPTMRPLILTDCPHDPELLSRDIFAPWLAIVPIDDPEAALALETTSRYALGASIFGPTDAAIRLAARLPAGAVTINDLIVPTADPRLGFGGAHDSGFGTTRGPEGLLEMTRLRTVSIRRPRGFRPHLQPPLAQDAARMAGLIELLHAGADPRRALRRLLGRNRPAGHIRPS
jgi:acyl-CoA reductase-like NAD-dependent aldehyde dehydrogenase